ncbi:MAG TPA: hypothetical protein VGE38_07215 [Nocardioides sp.]|uniref:hypothetical protein n=1 Tax=Nocardioides sp. TaxID=35761 RepID=UPI002ED8288C
MVEKVVLVLLGAIPTIVVAYFAYRGAIGTSRDASKVATAENDTTQQDKAVEAWRSMVETMLNPMQQRITELQTDLNAERAAREAAGEQHRRELDRHAETVRNLTRELDEWRRVARVLAKWGTALRDEVLRLGGTVPMTPEELLTLHAIEDRGNPHRPT